MSIRLIALIGLVAAASAIAQTVISTGNVSTVNVRGVARAGVLKPAAGGAFSPDQVSGMIAWWKADAEVYSDDGTTLAVNNDTVRRWDDQSGNNQNLGQTDAGQRPLFKTSIVNGLPGVHFGLTDTDNMTSSWASAKSQPLTVFVLAITTNAAGYRFFYDAPGGVNRTAALFSPTDTVIASDGATNLESSGAGPQDSFAVFTFFHSGASSYIRTNGVQQVAGSAGTGTSDGVIMGAHNNTGLNLDGFITEMIWYNATLSDSDRNSVENYLKTRAGL